MTKFPIIDGHNDTLLRLQESGDAPSFFTESTVGHIDMPRAKKGGFAGGFFAVYTPNEAYKVEPENYVTEDGYDMPLPPPISHEQALTFSNALASRLFRLKAQSAGRMQVVRTADTLQYCLQHDIMAAIFHIEGAEAIDTNFDALHVLYQAGLRSLGIVWSRPNKFGEGVPFRYPSTPDTGAGLTNAGKDLVRECNQLGIMIDNTHLNEKGFWDVAKLTDAPLVATHSNVHALSPIARNLTDQQLAAIAESNGVVGINYAVNMLREDCGFGTDISLDEIVRHITYIAEKFGVDHVALGSDFDGTTIPDSLNDVSGLPKLMNRLLAHGFHENELQKITHQNWVRVLRDTWK
ncbi:membrane dipeptidase [Lentibacillus cibarius]|uniref:Membrane dipeptidase n=1 Tax=Lentibacillus cibarius TaxID=2583219 RepID=A0A549YET4_9BACI|nr:dipeptidase [Lentibacillus cibarius]TMN21496.1 membrane dipeptidase [Lentibacillus cibarius]TRM10394.1 membrane dipeptidase [Lentibacillus cibarius]